MNLRSLIAMFFISLVFAGQVFGQRAKMKRADAYFETLSYNDAIRTYLEVLDKRDVDRAKVNLAEAYRRIGNMSEAEYWYGQSVRLPDALPEHKLFYAMALQTNGKCDLAIRWFEEYSKERPKDLRGELLKESCRDDVYYAFSNGDETNYKINHLRAVNSDLDDFGAAFFGSGIVFTSERDRGAAVVRVHTWTGDPFLELYYSEIETAPMDTTGVFNYGKPVKYSNKLNTKFHDGPLCFSSDQRTVYFTRNNIIRGKTGRDDEGIVRLKIFSAVYNGNDWTDIQGMPFNSDEYSVAHPAVSSDGEMMIFASDMPGGFGGMDLYISKFENGRWSPAINLNSYIAGINTEGNEIFPSIHTDGTLFFTSNGHTGLGGLDILYVKKVNNNWGPITNMRAPINSSADDFALTMNNEKTFGFFSSNRGGGVGNDDIYSFNRLMVDVEVLVFDENTGKPIEGAVVNHNCRKNRPVATGSDGKVLFELPLQKDCSLTASMDKYLNNTTNISTSAYRSGERIFIQIPLKAPLEFQLAGMVSNEKNNRALKGVTLTLSNDCGDILQVEKSEKGGTYNFELEADCCYAIKAEKEGYLTKAQDICTRNKKVSENFTANLALAPIPKTGTPPVATTEPPVVVITPPTPPVTTTPVEPPVVTTTSPTPNSSPVAEYFDKIPIVIYHDFDKANVKSFDENVLLRVLEMMNKYSEISIEVASHTDSRGNAEYNLLLSQRRAETVSNFLVNNGISRERIITRGYGESQIQNHCVDGVYCSEKEHLRNRRTEIIPY